MRAVTISKSEGDVLKVLTDVGFTAQLLKNSVLELSGGWRMKLALAGAILRSTYVCYMYVYIYIYIYLYINMCIYTYIYSLRVGGA